MWLVYCNSYYSWCEAIISPLPKNGLKVKPITTEEYYYCVCLVRFIQTNIELGNAVLDLFSAKIDPSQGAHRKVNPQLIIYLHYWPLCRNICQELGGGFNIRLSTSVNALIQCHKLMAQTYQ